MSLAPAASPAATDPLSGAALLRAKSLYDSGDYAGALPHFEEARRLGAGSAELLKRLAYCLLEADEYDRAVAPLEELTRLEPGNAWAWERLGYCHFQADRFAESEAADARTIEAGSATDPHVWLRRGRALEALDRLEEADQCLDRAEALGADALWLHTYRSRIRWLQARWEEAAFHYTRVAELDPEAAYSFTVAGDLMMRLERFRKAGDLFRRALASPHLPPETREEVRKKQREARLFCLPRFLYLPVLFVRFFRRAVFLVTRGNWVQSDEELQEFGRYSLDRCIEWFDRSVDTDWETVTSTDDYSHCRFRAAWRTFYVAIDFEEQGKQERFHSMGHEMYHRVTAYRKFAPKPPLPAPETPPGLHRHVWVDEMLADLAAYRLLRETGREAIAEGMIRAYLDVSGSLSHAELLTAQRVRRAPLTDPGAMYPDGFGRAMTKMGRAMETAVGWEALCRMVRCTSFDEWLGTLPTGETREAARRLLEQGPEA